MQTTPMTVDDLDILNEEIAEFEGWARIGSPKVTILAEVLIDGRVYAKKLFEQISVMHESKVRAWVTRETNKIIKTVQPGILVCGRYHGTLANPPFSSYEGYLVGLDGKIVKRGGTFDQSGWNT